MAHSFLKQSGAPVQPVHLRTESLCRPPLRHELSTSAPLLPCRISPRRAPSSSPASSHGGRSPYPRWRGGARCETCVPGPVFGRGIPSVVRRRDGGQRTVRARPRSERRGREGNHVQGGERFRLAHRRYEYAFRERGNRNLRASKGAKVNK